MLGLVHPSQRRRPVRAGPAPGAGPVAGPRPVLPLTAPTWRTPAFPLVVQRVTDLPSGVTVVIEGGTGRVLRVTNNDTQGEIPFVIVGEHKGDFAEGMAVLTLVKGKVSTVRFASTYTEGSDLAAMDKVKFSLSTVSRVEDPGLKPTEKKEEPARFDLSVRKAGGLLKGRKFTGFEVTPEGNQGDIHFTKHGKEFGASSKQEYIKMAKEFGEVGGKKFCEAIVSNTLIRVDPEGMKKRQVFIANGRQIRTFYIWDPKVSSDPFASAIYHTITHNMKIPLRKVDPSILKELGDAGVDVFAMERERVRRVLAEGKSIKEVQEQTLAPEAVIREVLAALHTTVAPSGGQSPSRSLQE